MQSDYFGGTALNPRWHFLSKKAASLYSLTAREGWLRLLPDSGRAHIVQKETDHYYTAVTLVDFNAGDSNARAGIWLTNGNQRTIVRLYSGFDGEKKIIFKFDTAFRSIANQYGNTVWLKLERTGHSLTGYYSGDGKKWTVVGAPISSVNLDKAQPNYNSWVGTSVGLFAEGKPADFDFFVCKDGFSTLPANGYSNYYGIETVNDASKKSVTSSSDYGGWFMISGVDLGNGKNIASRLSVLASSKAATHVEIWLDDFAPGNLIAVIPIDKTEGEQNNWKAFSKAIKHVSGQHDLFVRFPKGSEHSLMIHAVRFLREGENN